MKLTKNSELLMSFFLNKKYINHVNQTAKTDNILKKLYNVQYMYVLCTVFIYI